VVLTVRFLIYPARNHPFSVVIDSLGVEFVDATLLHPLSVR